MSRSLIICCVPPFDDGMPPRRPRFPGCATLRLCLIMVSMIDSCLRLIHQPLTFWLTIFLDSIDDLSMGSLPPMVHSVSAAGGAGSILGRADNRSSPETCCVWSSSKLKNCCQYQYCQEIEGHIDFQLGNMLLVEGNSPKVTPTPVISETSWCWEIGLWGCWGVLCVVEVFVCWCVHLQMTKILYA